VHWKEKYHKIERGRRRGDIMTLAAHWDGAPQRMLLRNEAGRAP
jgi:hypothetical protein